MGVHLDQTETFVNTCEILSGKRAGKVQADGTRLSRVTFSYSTLHASSYGTYILRVCSMCRYMWCLIQFLSFPNSSHLLLLVPELS